MRHSHRLAVLLAFVVGLAILVAGAMLYSTWRHPGTYRRVSVEQVEKELGANVRPGIDRSDVEAYLDRKAIDHSWVKSDLTELAMIRDSSSTALVRGDIQIVFKFDEAEKLATYRVTELFTGP